MRMALAFAFATAILMTTVGASAQSSSCALPLVEYGSIKGEIDSRASSLKAFIGDITFKGQVNVLKNELLLRYPRADQSSLKQYFLYIVCLQIMNDTKFDTIEKTKAFREATDVLFPP